MEKQPVLFLDSGIGGIPYCRHFLKRNTGENIVYLADRRHFPYGRRNKNELTGILGPLIEQLIQTFNPKIAVLACNTATLAALSDLRDRFPALPFVGTIPAVKPAALASKTGKIGVLGTELTIKEPNIRELAARYGNNKIIGIAAPELVKFIENNLFTATEETTQHMVRDYLSRFRAAGADTLVLGCTHFLFLQEDFQQEAAPDITVFDSLMGITLRIESLLGAGLLHEKNRKKSTAPSKRQGCLLLTGPEPPEPSWAHWADHLGFQLSLLEIP